MNTTIQAETGELLASLDAQILQAEANLATAERDLARAARAARHLDQSRGEQAGDGHHLDRQAREVDGTQRVLEALKDRRSRVLILASLKEKEDAKAEKAAKEHEALVKKHSATLKKELAGLADSAQKTADLSFAAIRAARDAVAQASKHRAVVREAAERIQALGLSSSDDYQSYDTGASIERGRATVAHGDTVYTSPSDRDLHGLLAWIATQTAKAELGGRESGAGHIHSLDRAIRDRLTQ